MCLSSLTVYSLFQSEKCPIFVGMRSLAVPLFPPVTNTTFIAALEDGVARYVAGGTNNSLAEITGDLMLLLRYLKYDPSTGFPDDSDMPAVEPGSLADLSSFERLTLILETERALVTGLRAKIANASPISKMLYPAYELQRFITRRQTDDRLDRDDWLERWDLVGGPTPVLDGQTTRLIAGNDDPVWAALGSSANFDDALDTDYPPFALGSGYYWQAVPQTEIRRLGVEIHDGQNIDVSVDTQRLDPQTKASKLAKLHDAQAKLEAFLTE